MPHFNCASSDQVRPKSDKWSIRDQGEYLVDFYHVSEYLAIRVTCALAGAGLALVDDEVAQILVVDDQTSNLEAIEALLSPSGCRLVRAHSANEALLAEAGVDPSHIETARQLATRAAQRAHVIPARARRRAGIGERRGRGPDHGALDQRTAGRGVGARPLRDLHVGLLDQRSVRLARRRVRLRARPSPARGGAPGLRR
jgi:hypothetical protein